MIVCPACSQHNPEGAQLCRACGASLADFVYRACPACGSLNGAERIFCRRCLAHLTEPSDEDLQHGHALAETHGAHRAAQPTPASASPASPEPQALRVEPNPLLPGAWLGDLQELTDLLPLAASTAQPRRAALEPAALPDAVDRQDAVLFQRLATQPAPMGESTRAASPVEHAALGRTLRALLAGLVLLAALIPWVTRGRLTARGGELPTALPELTMLAASDTTWVVVDYSPAYADELEPLLVAVLDALGQGSARVALLTTQPAGKGLAARAIQAVRPTTAPAAFDERFAWLGYLPATEASLQVLRAGQPIPARIALVSESEAGARLWIEQIGALSGVPLEAWVSARVAPLLIPYQRSGQLARLVAGPADRQAPDRLLAALLHDGLAAYILVLIVAAGLGLATRAGRRSAKRATQSEAR